MRRDERTTPFSIERFGFADPWDSWMERIREIEHPSALGAIGPYEILEEVGRGGQGVVYRARRLADGTRIALKRLVAGSFASALGRQRLERELELTARLAHPNIVRMLGLDHVDGQPLLAMEWLDGEPLTQWAGSRRERLAVFVKVCGAVQHAHEHGVIHRDLKPGNILVSAAGEPTVLDFGIARAERDTSRCTATGEFVGTPGYAAPEQRDANGSCGTRGDVFALGVILYELVMGTLPDEAAAGTAIDDRDLAAVVATAMHADAAQRYASAVALADDVSRWLDGAPVSARRASAWTRAIRGLRRHRVLATCLVLLLGWTVTATVLLVRLRAADAATTSARRDSHDLTTFARTMIAAANPTQLGADSRLLDFLDATAARLRNGLPEQPHARAAMHTSLGRTFASLLLSERAAHELRAAIGLLRAHPDPDDEVLASALSQLAVIEARRRAPGAIGLQREALALARGRHGVGSEAALDHAAMLAFVTWRAGGRQRRQVAIALCREVLARMKGRIDPGSADFARSRYHLGAMLAEDGRHEAALAELAAAAAILRPLAKAAARHEPALAWIQYESAGVLLTLRRHEDARRWIREAMPLFEKSLGPAMLTFCVSRLARIDSLTGEHARCIDHTHRAAALAYRAAARQERTAERRTELTTRGDALAQRQLELPPRRYADLVVGAFEVRGDEPRARRGFSWQLAHALAEIGHAGHAAAVRVRSRGQ